MHETLVRWRRTSAALGVTVVVLASQALLSGPRASPIERSGLVVSVVIGTGLLLIGFVLPRLLTRLWADDPLGNAVERGAQPPLHTRRPYATLFIASFIALFVEVLLIRYTGSQIRIFAFFKNIPLIASFLGLGLGLWLGSGTPRAAHRFLLWLVPLIVFLAAGAPIVDSYLGLAASAASSELILGDEIVRDSGPAIRLLGQVLVGSFSAAVLVAILLVFMPLGQLLADAFVGVGRLAGYTVNILGSLAGVVGFAALSFLETPPWVWLLAGLLPLLWWMPPGRRQGFGLALIGLSTVISVPSQGDTVWSPYQKLVGSHDQVRGGDGEFADGYLVQLSDVFYQLALDLRPEALERYGFHPYPHYDAAFDLIPRLDRVLIVGSGTGNDVAAALRADAGAVDAVEIDPAIVRMGGQHHPELPYSDGRVRVVVEDARKAFREMEPGTYDAVVFGLLDSHTQLGVSSLRLDNFVFTLESFRSAADLLRPGGWMIVTAATFRPWFRDRLRAMLELTCGTGVEIRSYGSWVNYRCQNAGPAASRAVATTDPPAQAETALPTDDWPFLYLETRGIPGGYLFTVGLLALVAILVLRGSGLRFGGFTPYHGHLFFLGAAFLLMEVHAINRLALLFGTTWLVSAVTITLVLTLIVAANLTVLAFGTISYGLAYAALALSLLASFSLGPESVLGGGLLMQSAYGLLVLSPVFFAGLVFARSFRTAAVAGTALGANIFGSAVGGWLEYSTMAFGIRSAVLLAGSLYLASFVAHRQDARGLRAPQPG